MQFIRTRRPALLLALRASSKPSHPSVHASTQPPTARIAVQIDRRNPEWAELAGACAMIAVFLVMAMFG